MTALVYALIAVIAALCSLLLLRRYARSGARLLLWSAVCFGGLTLSNIVLFVDLVLFPGGDQLNLRLMITAGALALLVYGFIWDSA